MVKSCLKRNEKEEREEKNVKNLEQKHDYVHGNRCEFSPIEQTSNSVRRVIGYPINGFASGYILPDM